MRKKFEPGQTVWVKATYRHYDDGGGAHLVYNSWITGEPGESWHYDFNICADPPKNFSPPAFTRLEELAVELARLVLARKE